RLAGDVRRAVGLASPALGAAVEVEPVLPGQVPDGLRAELLGLEVRGGERPAAVQALEEDVGKRGDDVEVLPQWEEVQEGEDDRQVHPEHGGTEPPDHTLRQR